MSDPYNPLEKELQLTRQALEIIKTFGFGVAIATKNPLITRDIDVLKDIRKRSPVIVKMTITTADDVLCKKIEPNVPVSSERFKAIKELSDHGIYCGILLMPILPFINDTQENILEIVRLGKENSAGFIYPSFGVTLRDKQRDYFYAQLDKHFPNIKLNICRNSGTNTAAAVQMLRHFMQASQRNASGFHYSIKCLISYRDKSSSREIHSFRLFEFSEDFLT